MKLNVLAFAVLISSPAAFAGGDSPFSDAVAAWNLSDLSDSAG